MATRTTKTTKTTGKTGAKTASKVPARKLTKPVLVQGEPPAEMADTAPAAEAAPKGSGLRLKDLVERVVAATGGKRKGVKEVVEATLAAMGDALQRGESLHLPAFGKARVAKSPEGGAMTVKLRRGDGARGKKAAAPGADTDALAEASDQG